MPIVLGVDPGATGALAFVDGSVILCMIDHSTWANHHQPYKELRAVLWSQHHPAIVVIEQQHARATYGADGKRKQGIASTWKYAAHYGILLGCLTAYDVPIHEVDPGVWKGAMHLPGGRDKTKSLELARLMWPHEAHEFFRYKKNDGRAEAALIAEYGKRFLPMVRRRTL